jgi:ankyrin repeat protein
MKNLLLNLVTLLLSLTFANADDTVPEARLLSACMNPKRADNDAYTMNQVRTALNAGADIDIVDVRSGQTPLMAAILRGKADIVQFLLDRGADVTIAEKDGYTPAHGAAFAGQAEILKILKEHGIDVITDVHSDGFLPFHRACWGKTAGHTAAVEYLLKLGVDPDLEASDGNRCIEMTKSSKTEQLLLSYGAAHARDDDDEEDEEEDEL